MKLNKVNHRLLIAIFTFIGSFSISTSIAQHAITVKHHYYTLWYDTLLREPLMGYYVQTTAHATISIDPERKLDRKTFGKSFSEDPLIDDKYEYDNKACYKGWNKAHPENRIDKGHLNPYSAFDFDTTAAVESMYFSNTCPQSSYFNEHQWERVEQYVLKNVALEHDSIQVWTGVLTNENTAIKVGQLAIPDYYWKVIAYKNKGKLEYKAWLGQNAASNTSTDPDDIVVPLADLKTKIHGYYPKLKLSF
jgi:endonuclease G